MQARNPAVRTDAFTPARLWLYVVNNRVVGMHLNPKRLTSIILAGRMEPYTIDIMITVVETAKIINKITGKDPHHGA